MVLLFQQPGFGHVLRVAEDVANEENLLRGIWQEVGNKDSVLETPKAECEVRVGRQEDCFP